MRLIDADKAFEKFLQMWGVEVDAEIASMFMKTINDCETVCPAIYGMEFRGVWKDTENENVALTIDELRSMDGEPVWVEMKTGEKFWGVICVHNDKSGFVCYTSRYDRVIYDMCYGMDGNAGWIAYRRKP